MLKLVGDNETEPWICDRCQQGRHLDCFSAKLCTCTHGTFSEWLTPDRRGELRTGAVPRTPLEKRYQDGIFAHRAERAAAEERRR
ncbi:hypothetical protein [Longimicrobium sp.]|uniref:hypothetical protein n=1 Tax=Longimicrobium sp. TaxID=2029185 RepID=UPI002ED8052F